jgi:thiol-disulfide isomerase/thioredoxin
MWSSVYRDNLIDYNKLKFILKSIVKKILIFLIFTFILSSNAISKETTYKKELFDKALLEGKVVVVSSWIKYCTSCASQMKILNKAKNDFDNIEYFAFDVTNKEIAEFFNVQYQTTLLIFKDNKEVYRSIGETTKELIYDALKSSI